MQVSDLLRFHLTGQPAADTRTERRGIWPAILAPLRDLSALRYDFPLVLVDDGDPVTVSLSGLFDVLLRDVAPQGPAGERLRRHVLSLEHHIRHAVSGGQAELLSRLWEAAAKEIVAETGPEEAHVAQKSLDQARAALEVDGRVVDCDDEFATRFVEHVWLTIGRRQAMAAQAKIDELIMSLSHILQADFARSKAGLSPDKLAGSLGPGYHHVFDFEAWSRLVTGRPTDGLEPGRRRRIETILAILEGQRFFAGGRVTPYGFRFESAIEAATAFRRRVPEMLELVKAMTMARLEIENRYRDAEHGSFFESFDQTSPTSRDLADFPSYLVCMRGEDLAGMEKAELVDILASDLPMKVLVETSNVFGDSQTDDVRWSPGVGGGRLGSLAVGLGEAFVLQVAGSHLPQMEESTIAGLSYQGPALFSVFSGSDQHFPDLPRYLSAASAMQSRAFPAFTYDPGAGDDWAARFRMDGNPQAAEDWPVEELTYEDDDLQRVTEEMRFTFVDFVACDARHAEAFQSVPRKTWNDEMEPAWRFLNGEAPPGKVPYVLMVNGEGELQRLVVRKEVIEAAHHCRRQWHSLQELAGIHNSHARRLLERERTRWQEEQALERPDGTGAAAPVVQEHPASEMELAAVDEEAAVEEMDEPRSTDEAYIETARCTTCDECTTINPGMFAYDENKQAYIADLTAGTYRQMVEAAEACQVAIIHPGKPWDESEADLPQLIARAAALG